MSEAPTYLTAQFETAWRLMDYHLKGLTTEECLWRPAPRGWHVHRDASGVWRAEWPDREDYVAGPPTIAWLTWHVDFWWSMALNHSFGDATLTRERVHWPGDAQPMRDRLHALCAEWRQALQRLSCDDLASDSRTRWPFQGRPFGELVAWVNLELMKNAAEIGYARFLFACHATRD